VRILETFVNNIRRDTQVEGHSRNMWTSVPHWQIWM